MTDQPIALDPTGKAERANKPALIVLLILGAGAIGLSLALDTEILPAVVLEIGAGVLLFSALFVVERSFIRKQTRALLEAIDPVDQSPEEFQKTHSDEEIERMFSPQGPVAAAFAWAEAMIRGDYEEAWRTSEPNWRVCRVQSWLWNNRAIAEQANESLDDVATRILQASEDDPLWRNFVAVEREHFRQAWGGINLDDWGAASRSRPTGKDHELIILTPTGKFKHGYVVREAVALPQTMNLLMRSTQEGWKLASHASVAPPTPGWPPSWWIINDPAFTGGLHFGSDDRVRGRT